jgi:Glycosyl transferases group 1
LSCAIQIVVGRTHYHAAAHFLLCLAREWHALGFEINPGSRLPDWVVSINGASLVNLLDVRLAGVPRLELVIDDPIYLCPLFFWPVPEVRLACVDQTYCRSIEQLPGWENAPLFSPHGGWMLDTPERHRTIDLLFCGSYSSPHRLLSHLKERVANGQLLQQWHPWMRGLILSDELIPICSMVQPNEWELIHHDPELGKTLRTLDQYLRARRRYLLLQQCADAGLIVDLYGDGWDNSPFKEVHRVCGSIPFHHLPHLMAGAKIALNAMPNFAHGLHERLLTAMGAGALVITESNPFLSEQFVEGEEFLTFEGADQLKSLLSDGERRQEVAEAGKRRARSGHSWEARARSLAQAVFSPAR